MPYVLTAPMPLEQRVKRGASVMDVIDPSWREDIDPFNLHMASTTSCVLGQRFEFYDLGMQRIMAAVENGKIDVSDLPLSERRDIADRCLIAYALGFDTDAHLVAGDQTTYVDLQDAWLKEIGNEDAIADFDAHDPYGPDAGPYRYEEN